MKWEGSKIKALAKQRGLSIQSLASEVGVSRQTVNDWINGQIPKGNHLIHICKIFQLNPEELFIEDIQRFLNMPAHRTRMGAKVTPEMQTVAISLSKEYINFFRNYKKSLVVPVVRSQDFNLENAKIVANQLRELSGIETDKPIDYEHTFNLAKSLNISIIFRYFPDILRDYAFYTRISNQRVIFVNNSTITLDIIFPLLHEFIHAIKDESKVDIEYNSQEEKFCDLVAHFVQFPQTYVEIVFSAISGRTESLKVKLLKKFSKSYSHSIHGIVKAIKLYYPEFNIRYGGADTNLKKEFPSIGDVLFYENETRIYVSSLKKLSGSFYPILLDQITSISEKKLAELLGLESILDARGVKSEIKRDLDLQYN